MATENPGGDTLGPAANNEEHVNRDSEPDTVAVMNQRLTVLQA